MRESRWVVGVTCSAPYIPIPVNFTVTEACLGSSLLSERLPMKGPPAGGVNSTVIVTFSPWLSTKSPPPAVTLNGPVVAPTLPCSTPGPEFLIVKFFETLVALVLANERRPDAWSLPGAPLPVSLTFTDGRFGSLLVIVSISESAPGAVGANCTVTLPF